MPVCMYEGCASEAGPYTKVSSVLRAQLSSLCSTLQILINVKTQGTALTII